MAKTKELEVDPKPKDRSIKSGTVKVRVRDNVVIDGKQRNAGEVLDLARDEYESAVKQDLVEPIESDGA